MIQVLVVMMVILVSANFSCRNKPVDYQHAPAFEIKIGALIAHTGSGSSTGESSLVSLELALRDAEKRLYGLGQKVTIRLVVEDTQTDTAVALRLLRGMYDQGIRLVVGPYSSASLAHLKSFADREGMLLVSPSSVATSLALPNDNVFRFVTSADPASDLLAAVSADFEQGGGTLHDPVIYPVNTTDFSMYLETLNDEVLIGCTQCGTGKVAVYLACFGEGVTILKQADEYTHLKTVTWYGSSAFAQNGDAVKDPDAAAFASSRGFPCPIFGLDESARFKWQPLKDEIAARIGREPDVYALTAYDALWIAARTLVTAGRSGDIQKLTSLFISFAADYFGVTGNTALNKNGDRAHGNYDFWAIKDAESIYKWHRVAVYNSAAHTLTRY